MEIHELNTFSGTLGSSDFFATDNGNDTSKVSAEAMFAPLNARIDNIIAGPAPSAEEIVDARLGANGVTYLSLGDAIRTQVTDVKSDIGDLFDGYQNYYIPQTYWENKGINGSTGDVADQSNRLKTVNYVEHDIKTIKAKSGYDISLFLYSSGSFVGVWDGTSIVTGAPVWLSEIENQTAYDCYIVARRTDNTDISASEGTNIVFVEKVIEDALVDLAYKIEDLYNGYRYASLPESNWENKGINAGNGSIADQSNRLKTIGYLSKTAKSAKANSGYEFCLYLYSSGSFVGIYDGTQVRTDGGVPIWITSSPNPTEYDCYLVARRTDNADILVSEGANIIFSDIANDDDSYSVDTFPYIVKKLSGAFNSPSTVVGGAPTDTVNLINCNPAVICDLYDDLVASGLLTKTSLGTVSGYEFPMYTLKHDSFTNNTGYALKLPKILITAGVHGYEQGSVWNLYNFFKVMGEGVNDDLNKIRNLVDIKIIPICNPYGFAHNERKNANGVDINRNFDADFTVTTTDPTSEYYSGLTAGSETETQLISNFIDDNLDADYVIDIHNIANGNPLFYIYNKEQVVLGHSVFSQLTQEWAEEYPTAGFNNGTIFGYCNSGVNACIAKYAIKQGIDSFVLETPWIMPLVGIVKYDTNTTRTGVEVLATAILAILKWKFDM